MGLRPVPELTSSARVTSEETSTTGNSDEESIQYVQQIIALPLSEPYIEEEAYY